MAGIDAYSSAMNNYYGLYGSSASSAASSVFDVGAAQSAAKKQADELLSSLKSGKDTVKTLKDDTAKYLDQYSLAMKKLDQSANALRNDSLDRLLYNFEGEVTDDTVAKTVKAAQQMVDDYNSTVKLLNDNADRGPGTMKQLARMVDDPAPAASMEMVGVTVNKDGTLALDAGKLTEALKTTDKNQLALYEDILGGWGGIADNIHKDALYGSNAPARDLIRNDLATIQEKDNESNPFREMWNSIKGNVYALNNQAVTGLLMNMLV